MAWQVVRVYGETMQKKRLPDPRTLVKRSGEDSSPRQSIAKMRAALKVMSEQYGIPLRKAGDKTPMKPRQPKVRRRRKELHRGE